jgi:antitoxin MazE
MYLLRRYHDGGVDVETRVQKWGNSLALRIPKPFAAEVGLESDSFVELTLVDGKLVITPITKPTLTLEQLLAQVNEHNLHGEVDTGLAVGNEVW